MKLNKMKIARLTYKQAESINGGGGWSDNSTNNGFTCCMCTAGNSFECDSVNPNDPINCNPGPSPKL